MPMLLPCLRFRRAFVGGAHQSGAAAGHDVAAHRCEGIRQALDLAVHPVARLGPSRTEDRDAIAFAPRRLQASQTVDDAPEPEDRVHQDLFYALFVVQLDRPGALIRLVHVHPFLGGWRV
jgi:hypothetical protein